MQTRKMIFVDEFKKKLTSNPPNSFISISAVEAMLNDCSFLEISPEIITGVNQLKECVSKTSATANLRPCYAYIGNGLKNALFHGWVSIMINKEGVNEMSVSAIVEFENGTVYTVDPKQIRFIDTSEIMKEYAFDEEQGG